MTNMTMQCWPSPVLQVMLTLQPSSLAASGAMFWAASACNTAATTLSLSLSHSWLSSIDWERDAELDDVPLTDLYSFVVSLAKQPSSLKSFWSCTKVVFGFPSPMDPPIGVYLQAASGIAGNPSPDTAW